MVALSQSGRAQLLTSVTLAFRILVSSLTFPSCPDAFSCVRSFIVRYRELTHSPGFCSMSITLSQSCEHEWTKASYYCLLYAHTVIMQ